MKIKGFIAGLTAASLAAMTSAAISASAVSSVGAQATRSSLAKSNAHSAASQSVNHDISNGTPDIDDDGNVTVDTVDNSVPLLVIVVGFSNVDYDTEQDWGNDIFRDEYSISRYFTDMSSGKFTYTPVKESCKYDGGTNLNTADKENDGIVHVTLDSEHGAWGDLQDDEAAYEYQAAFIDAIEAADEYVDFASYDTDQDNFIDTEEMGICFIVAGKEAGFVGTNVEGSFWGHHWTFSKICDEKGIDYPAPDGTEIIRYAAVGEKFGDEEADRIADVNVLTHELCHYIGLSDYYNTLSDYYELTDEWYNTLPDIFSPMDMGVWGKSPTGVGYRPYAMDMVSKIILGWANTEYVTESGTYEIAAEDYYTRQGEHKALVIPTQNPDEYYVLEIRNNNKWDKYLSENIPGRFSDGGIVFYHVDRNVWFEPSPYGSGWSNGEINTVNSAGHRPGVAVLNLEQDFNGELSLIGNDPLFDLTIPTEENTEGSYSKVNVFSKSMWEYYAADALGSELNLPIYSPYEPNKDDPSARILSGIKIEFLDDVGETMHVKITMPETEPEPEIDDDDSDLPESEGSSAVDETSSGSKITETPVANTGAGSGLGAVAAVVTGALIIVVSRKRK